MKYVNQYSHRDIPYHHKVLKEGVREIDKIRNVAQSGCGLCCACMMVEQLTNMTLTIEDCVKIAEECVANHSTGTDLKILGPVLAEKFGVNYAESNELDEAIKCLQCGGHIIAHVTVPEGEEIGLFTKHGHYISLISTDGKDFCILDPSYTADKFNIPERAGKVDTSHAPYLYCDVNVVDRETKATKVKYYMFSRKR